MKSFLVVLALLGCGLCGCASTKEPAEHAAWQANRVGGPYYFRSYTVAPGGPIVLQGELLPDEARAHAASGAPLFTAWFGDNGLPTRVEKRYRGALLRQITYRYEGTRPIEVRWVDDHGREVSRGM